MRRVAILAALLLGCARPSAPEPPSAYIRLGTAYQVCANRAGYVEQAVFIHLVRMGERDVIVDLNGRERVTLHGEVVTVTYMAGIGSHTVTADIAGYHPITASFSVWNCAEGAKS